MPKEATADGPGALIARIDAWLADHVRDGAVQPDGAEAVRLLRAAAQAAQDSLAAIRRGCAAAAAAVGGAGVLGILAAAQAEDNLRRTAPASSREGRPAHPHAVQHITRKSGGRTR